MDQVEAMEEDLEVETLEEIIITIEIKSLKPSQRLNPSLSTPGKAPTATYDTIFEAMTDTFQKDYKFGYDLAHPAPRKAHGPIK